MSPRGGGKSKFVDWVGNEGGGPTQKGREVLDLGRVGDDLLAEEFRPKGPEGVIREGTL